MANIGEHLAITLTAGEALTSNLYTAIALDDGKVANSGAESCGILLSKPASGEGMNVGIVGNMPFYAGAAVAKGAKLTVTTSGFMITATSGTFVVGVSTAAVTSGSIGNGNFSFPTKTYCVNSNAIV